jgi:hypothetical protein
LLATASDPAVRDPVAAIPIAEQAVARWPAPWIIDTLATAYANAGRWSDALATEDRAIAAAAPGADDLHVLEARRAQFARCQPHYLPRAMEREADDWATAVRDYGWKTEQLPKLDALGLSIELPPSRCAGAR